ncbi:MAG: hypothetical protein Q9168_004347 [Polycauliona sp. 1 TL-2023]
MQSLLESWFIQATMRRLAQHITDPQCVEVRLRNQLDNCAKANTPKVPLQHSFLDHHADFLTLASNSPFIYPLPSEPTLVLRFSGKPGTPLSRTDAKHAISSLHVALVHWMTRTSDSRHDPVRFRMSRTTRSVQAEIGRLPSAAIDGDGPRDGKSRTVARLMTFEDGVQAIAAMYAMMKKHGFVSRWAEVVERAVAEGEEGVRGPGNVIGFVRVTERPVDAPAPGPGTIGG